MTNEHVGRFPLRRVVVAFFLCAAVAGGIGRWTGGETAPVTAATVDGYMVTAAGGSYQTIIDADGDTWDCAGEPSADTCTIHESADPGPFEELGYRSLEIADYYCPGGVVHTLYRRGQVAGYGCEVGDHE